ncbi:MAG TPA: HD domain-containing protein [Methanobacterium sp.]|nr:HD domain-containing protein [Methanobacterium sp.]
MQSKLQGECSGHDWWHVYRVWKNSIYISRKENADLLVTQLAALLHDIADWKFHGGNEDIGPEVAREWLEKLHVDEDTISHVTEIVRDISFKGAGVKLQAGSQIDQHFPLCRCRLNFSKHGKHAPSHVQNFLPVIYSAQISRFV